MHNPFQAGTPSFGGDHDPLAFVKQLWGGMQIPGIATPTLSLDELDKQIQDLKTVESWLSLNMHMLKSSIHALEVQRSTIAALKAMGESFAQNAGVNPTKDSPDVADPLMAENQSEEQDLPRTSTSSNSDQAQAPAMAAPIFPADASMNPALWWNKLQAQFKQAVQNAMQDEPDEPDASANQTPQARSTVAKKSTPRTSKKAATTSASTRKTATSKTSSVAQKKTVRSKATRA